VTSYKGLKETETKPGEFVSILGAAGGLGHLGVQYAKAMGMRVIALDVGKDKLEYTKRLGAEFAVDASSPTAIDEVNAITNGGSHGVLCLATNKPAFTLAVKIARRKGTAVLVGLPNSTFECPIVEIVLKRVTIRGSIVGTRKDMAEALDFAARGLVKCDVHMDKLENINKIVDDLRAGKIKGRTVIEFIKEKETH
jgi:propanol-preferring alcohol dehydrogenase